jgi:hypothetical protein
MRRFFQSTLLLASAAGVVGQFSCAQTTSSAREEDKSSEVVRRLNTQEVQAFLQKDAKAMARLWSDDFVVTNPLNKPAIPVPETRIETTQPLRLGIDLGLMRNQILR